MTVNKIYLGENGAENFEKFLAEKNLSIPDLIRKIAKQGDTEKLDSLQRALYRWTKQKPLKVLSTPFQRVLKGLDTCVHQYPYMPEEELLLLGRCFNNFVGIWYVYLKDNNNNVVAQKMYLNEHFHQDKEALLCSFYLGHYKSTSVVQIDERLRHLNFHHIEKTSFYFGGSAFFPYSIENELVIPGYGLIVSETKLMGKVWVGIKESEKNLEKGKKILEIVQQNFLRREERIYGYIFSPPADFHQPVEKNLFGGGLISRKDR